MVIGSGPLVFRIKGFEVRWIPTGGSTSPGTYCFDIPIKQKLWVYRGGLLANGLSIFLWLHNPMWVFANVLAIWSNTRVVVFREKRTMTDGAWIALLRGGFRLPEGFEPCTEDSGFEGTQEG
ncbi:hypothetical protein TC41_1792 [Alicyclobacillus acidocaldarius subsp. acidocaldarius Tc-4-1]|uniref:Uncharacterized protein n=2 Tax=Alicyclobacillus acidocaldarius TaxID=405212 RepID=F8ICP7_ALIAT|nr:hypothetical protein TC41_1792 [Alicyclobacillus acidocaldarius subsp. acidocaldarius Tc-4-1]